MAALASLALAGCGNAGYYAQAVNGHLEIVKLSKPAGEVAADPGTPQPLKVKLETVQRMRDFASRDLGLPENGSYRRYADLKRPFVVWNVFAAPEFSVKLTEWCFPFAGCVGYRGYFSKDDADAYAAALRTEGLEVFVQGVPAYSTLGWFDDPLLNTFLAYPDVEVARILFHELAHQVVYVKDDSQFNESFATAVEREGVARWLAAHGKPGETAAFEALQARKAQFLELVLGARGELAALYASPLPDADKRARKRAILDGMQAGYRRLRESWNGWPGYDRWFAQDLTNAHVASVATYTNLVPAFQALLVQQGNDLPQFYASVRDLAALPRAERDARLAALAAPPAHARSIPRADGSGS